MKSRFIFFTGLTLVVLGIMAAFLLWFEGPDIKGANQQSRLILLAGPGIGSVLIVRSFNPRSFDPYVYWMTPAAIVYFCFPYFMSRYRTDRLGGETIEAAAQVTRTGVHKYKRRPDMNYYEFRMRYGKLFLTKWHEDIVSMSGWRLKPGDSLKIRYCKNNVHILEVIGPLK